MGYVDAPLLSVPTLAQRLRRHPAVLFDMQRLAGLSQEEREKHVVIVQDPFTSYYDADVVEDFVALQLKLGKTSIAAV